MPISRPSGVTSARVRWRSSFTMPKMGTCTAELLRHRLGGLGVGHAAVDEEHVRQGQELLVPVRRPLEPAAQHLLHGGVVVRMARQCP